jgi:FMN phosphatase YigB (HAD superfamily)
MKIAIRAHELTSLIDRLPAGTRWLSLDCFDTLVWRTVATPPDLFVELASEGGAIPLRQTADKLARNLCLIGGESQEISIERIHAELRPGGDIEASVAEEIAAEHRHCFGFQPTIDLIKAAKARGLGVIIVSDTYLNEAQLRALIVTACGAETEALLDHVFASADHGMSKGAGLFGPVLDTLGCRPTEIFHVGDNKHADQTSSAEFGINSAHLVQFDDRASERLRLEAAASSMVDPKVRVSVPAYQPHRALVSLRESDDAAHALGHDVLGPLLTGYAEWLNGEVAAIEKRDGRKTHLLFLMRDGHLPASVHETMFGEDTSRRIEVSRYTSTRASFVDRAAVRKYVAAQVQTVPAEITAGQMLYSRDEIAKLVPNPAKTDIRAFIAAVTSDAAADRTVARSGRFAERLVAHLHRAGVRPGDAVVLADIGYNGSVQNFLAPMLEQRMNVKSFGRYLLLREGAPSGLDKAGYLDVRNYDEPLLNALRDSVAVLEQLCTIAQGSVVDYKPDGKPVRASADAKGHQSATAEKAQAGCLDFARARIASSGPRAVSDTADAWRMAGVAALTRFLFLPTREEVAALSSFEHDINLGTKIKVDLFNAGEAELGLRRRGLIYLDEVTRVFLPGEIRRSNPALNLAMFAMRRFGLQLTGADVLGDPIQLSTMIAGPSGQTIVSTDAHPTYDGFYAAAIPMGAAQYSIGVMWGASFDWVEIMEARIHTVERFGEAHLRTAGVEATMIHEGVENVGGNLFRCSRESAFTLIPPPAQASGENLVLNLVFRPVVRRGETAEARAAA